MSEANEVYADTDGSSGDDAVFRHVMVTIIQVKSVMSYYDDMWLPSEIFGRSQYIDFEDRLRFLKCYFLLALHCPLQVTATAMEIHWEEKSQVPMVLRRDLFIN